MLHPIDALSLRNLQAIYGPFATPDEALMAALREEQLAIDLEHSGSRNLARLARQARDASHRCLTIASFLERA